MKLHTFGDSHRKYIYCYETDPDSVINKIIFNTGGPWTMSHFGLEKLNLLNIKDHGVAEGDAVCFCFGEIDCRSHLCKPENFEKHKDLIDYMVPHYFEAIKENVEQYENLTTLIYNVLPPCGHFLGGVPLHNQSSNDIYRFIGSDE